MGSSDQTLLDLEEGTSGSAHPLTQWHIPEHLNLKENAAVTRPGQVKLLPQACTAARHRRYIINMYLLHHALSGPCLD